MRDNLNYTTPFVVIVALFTGALITSNIIGVKLIAISGIVVSAGIITFPINYIFGDVLTEVYGYRKARLVIWLGFFCNLITVIAIWIGQMLPPAPFWDGHAAYERILGYTPRILLASFAAYIVGEFTNSYIMAKMKIATKGKRLWMRTISSTIAGQGIDTFVFTVIAFGGTCPLQAVISIIITEWVIKSLYEALFTPVTYKVVAFLKRYEGQDVYDYSTRFNPFLI